MLKTKTNVRRLQHENPTLVGIIALLVIGGMMIAQPDMYTDVEASGRKAFTKMIFKYIWGIPVGTICLAAGSFLAYKQLAPQSNSGYEK